MSKNKFKWKKILSIMLAVMLVVALLPNTVNATETDNGGNTAQISTVTLDEESGGTTDEAADNTDTQADEAESGVISDVENSTDDTQNSESSEGMSGEVDSSSAEDNTSSDNGEGEGETSEDSEQSDESGDNTQSEDTNLTSQGDSTLNSDVNSEEVLDTEMVEAVVALIDALPALDDLKLMTSEEQNDVYREVIKIYETYDTLNDEEKALISEESLDALYILLEYFNSQTNTTVVNNTKTITVDASVSENEGYTYNTIQEAINYIYGLTDEESAEDGWTINVAAGTYARFVVQPGVDNLTIEGVGDETVIKTLCDDNITVGKYDDCGIYKAAGVSSDTQGIIVDNAGNFTLKNVKITMGTNSTSWKSSAIGLTNGDTTMEADNGFTLDSCSIEGAGASEYSTGGIGVFADNMVDVITITNCTFIDCASAIYYENTHSGPESVSITGNVFTDCSFAFHGSWSSAPVSENTGTFTMTGNVITGSASLRNKIVIQDTEEKDAVIVTISNNELENGLIGVINLQSEGELNNVLENNTFGTNSFYVDAVEPGDINVTYASYEVPEDSIGCWVLTDIDDLEVDWGGNPEGAIEAVQAAVDAANAEGSTTLEITGLDSTGDGNIDTLVKTFTWFKDAIYWVSGTVPNLSKSILVTETSESGEVTTEEVAQADVAAQEDINFVLTSRVPTVLSNYIDYVTNEDGSITGSVQTEIVTDDEGNETEVYKTYELTFYDEMSSYLTIDEESIVIKVGDVDITDRKDDSGNLYYTYDLNAPLIEDEESGENTDSEEEGTDASEETTVTTKAMTVTIDLLALYTAEIIEDSDFDGTAETDTLITVSYTAQLSEDAPAGSYTNTAYVTYPEGSSDEATVQVDTYGLYIYKYDISTYSKGEDENTVPDADNSTPLANAQFTLYDEDNVEVGTVKTDGKGFASLSGLSSGTYYLKEITAPSGYVASTSQIFVEITSVAGSEDESPEHVISVQVANAKIPQTGGMGTQPFTLAGIALLASAGLVYVVTRRRDYLSR